MVEPFNRLRREIDEILSRANGLAASEQTAGPHSDPSDVTVTRLLVLSLGIMLVGSLFRALLPFGAGNWLVLVGASLFIPSFAAVAFGSHRVDLGIHIDWPNLFERLSVEMGFRIGRQQPPDALITSLADVVHRQERYEGKRLRLQGIVRCFTQTDGISYVVLEDSASNRVLLKPTSSVAALNGAIVCVEGRFSFADDAGRVLDVDAVRRA